MTTAPVQVGINPDMLNAPPRQCVGGPCDGQMMRVAPDHALIICDCKVPNEPLRAISMPPADGVNVAKEVGTYVGHYWVDGDLLHWGVS